MRQKTRTGKAVLAFTIGLLALCGILLAFILPRQSLEKVAVIDRYAVTEQELSFYMNKLRPAVQNEFQTKLQVTLSKEDWTKEFKGKQPLRELQERALEESLNDKTLLMIAKENKLIDYVGFSEMLKAMEKENRIRNAAADKGEIVYGLKQFSPESYYPHVLSSLKTKLKKVLSKKESDPLYIGTDEVEAYFQQNKADWAVKATSYKVTRLDIPAEQTDKAEYQADLDQLVQRHAGLDAIQDKYSNSNRSEEILGEEAVTNLNSYSNEVLSELRNTKAGELTAPVETHQGFTVYRLDETVFDEEKAWEEYKVHIRELMLDERLDEYIRSYRDSLEVKVNQKRMTEVGYE